MSLRTDLGAGGALRFLNEYLVDSLLEAREIIEAGRSKAERYTSSTLAGSTKNSGLGVNQTAQVTRQRHQHGCAHPQ